MESPFNWLKLILFTVFCLLISACIEIKESIKPQKDGSGHYCLSIDLAGAKSYMNHMLEHSNFQEEHLPQGTSIKGELAEVFEEASDRYRSLEGIYNVELEMDTANYYYNICFDYNNTYSLNNALSQEGQPSVIYLYEKKTFYKRNLYHLAPLTAGLSPSDLKDMQNKELYYLIQQVYDSIWYSFELQVPKKVLKYDNESYQLSEDKKQLVFKQKVKDINSTDFNIGNKVKFK